MAESILDRLPQIEFCSEGKHFTLSRLTVRFLVREGLTPRDYELLALASHALGCSIADLIGAAFEAEGRAQ